MSSACCPPAAAAVSPNTDHRDDDEFSELLADPTLESCCRRDLEGQRRSAALRSKLLSMDRTTQRTKMHHSILGAAAPRAGTMREETAAMREAEGENDDMSSSFGDSEEEDDDPGEHISKHACMPERHNERKRKSSTLPAFPM